MRITIENLPPIASGSFEVRPLTIFIGPNNTGKSRAALLPYVFAKSLATPFTSIVSTFPQSIREDPSAYFAKGGEPFGILRRELPEFLSAALDRRLPNDLVRYLHLTSDESGASHSPEPTISFTLASGESVRWAPGGLDRPTLDLSDAELIEVLAQSSGSAAYDAEFGTLWTAFKARVGLPVGNAYYLPAERGALASFVTFYLDVVLGSASASDRRSLLPPDAGDYLSTLLHSASRHAVGKGEFAAQVVAADLIEQRILKGRVTSAGSTSLPFPLIYSNIFEEGAERFTIELSSASSSVAEAGSLAMILKSHVKPGDLVVIDEPETNLHPANQRNIAQALVQLAAAGVTVVATTHSSTIIHQVSNLVRADGLSAESLKRLGWGDGDTLSHETVGIYLFKQAEAGVTISEIPFDAEYGYPEEEFYEVAERMVDETYRIDTVEAFAG